MCEVCAIFGAGEHWSDFGRLRDEKFPFDDIQHYRDERKRRIGLLNMVLAGVDVSCEDWDGEALMLFDRAGRSKLAPTASLASETRAVAFTAERVLVVFMALPFSVDSTPRAYTLKAGSADFPISTRGRTSPRDATLS